MTFSERPADKFRVILLLVLGLGAILSAVVPDSLAQAQSGAALHLIQSDADRIVVELEVSNYDVRTHRVGVANYSVLSISGLDTAAPPGKPRLPVKGTLIGIPSGAQANLKIIADDALRDALANPPLPEPTTRVEFDPTKLYPTGETSVFAPDATAFASRAGQLYPSDAARITSTGNWRSQRYIALEFSPLQYDAAARQLVFHRRLRVEITLGYAAGAARTGPPVKEGPFESVLQKNLLNYDSATNWRTRASAASLASKRSASYTGGPWFKIGVDTDGLYKVTCTSLRDEAGLDPADVTPNTLKVFKQGTELAITVSWADDGLCDDSHYVLFFGRAVDTKYTDTNVYWLTYGGASGKRAGSRNGTGTTLTSAFTDTVHFERNLLYRAYFPTIFPALSGVDHWFWNYLTPGYPPPYQVKSQDYIFQVTNPVSSGISPTLQVDLWGFSTKGHHTQIFVNTSKIYENATWSGKTELRVTIPFAQDLLTTTNTLRITELSDRDTYDFVFMNSFDVSYSRAFTVGADALQFHQVQSGAWEYRVDNFSSPDIQVFDVSSEFDMTRIDNATVDPAVCPCAVTFRDSQAAPRQYVVTTPAQYKIPLSVVADAAPVPGLRSTSNGADEIVISPASFKGSLDDLMNYRNKPPEFRVKWVDIQDVYDEFSDGLMDPQAIRDFLAYAYANWQPPSPSYVLLVGDGTFDPKGNCTLPNVCPKLTTPPNSTVIPPFLLDVDPWIGETVSDNRFVSFNDRLSLNDALGDTLPQMMIGRLPANNPAEAAIMATKIKNYETAPVAGDWRTKLLFVSDRPDTGDDYWFYSDAAANDLRYVPVPNVADRIYYLKEGYTDAGVARQAITSTINAGRLVVNYIGHGSLNLWSDGPLLLASDAASFSNGGRLPVMLDMTCWDGYFIDPGIESVAEANLRAVNGGALASWSPTGWGTADGHDFLDKGFLNSIFWSGSPVVGQAVSSAQANLWFNGGGQYRELIDTFILFGDPASRMNVPPIRRMYLPFVMNLPPVMQMFLPFIGY